MQKQLVSLLRVAYFAGLSLVGLCLASLALPSHADPLLKDGEKVAFLGDSITQYGAQYPGGYVRLVESGLATNGIKIEVLPAGIAGHKSNQMLERLDKDVLSHKPNWMTLSCGVNDVWHQSRGIGGVPLEDYKKNITEIVSRAQAAGVKVLIMTSTPIEESDNPNNRMLAGYNDFLKSLAKERNLPLADTGTAIWTELKAANFPKPMGTPYLTLDGVHMNPFGDQIMALEVLKAFGLNDEQRAKAQQSWMDVPNANNVRTSTQISYREYKGLAERAVQENKRIVDVMGEALALGVRQILATPAAKPTAK